MLSRVLRLASLWKRPTETRVRHELEIIKIIKIITWLITNGRSKCPCPS